MGGWAKTWVGIGPEARVAVPAGLAAEPVKAFAEATTDPAAAAPTGIGIEPED